MIKNAGSGFVQRALRPAAITLSVIAGAATAHAADIAITNVDYIDVDARQVVKGARIVIRDGRIVEAGPQSSALPEGTQVIDGSRFVALPGFVNAHTHLWQHVAKALLPGGDLQSWGPLVHQFLHYCTPGEMYEVTLAAAAEALLSGFTTTSDFASPYAEFTLDQTSAAMKTAGLDGVVVYWNPAAFLPPDIKKRQIERLAAEVAPMELWIAQGHAFLFEPPAIYEGVELARKLSLGLTEHTMETIQGTATVHGIYARYLEKYGDRLAAADRDAIAALVAAGPPSKVNGVRLIRRISRQLLGDPDTTAHLTPEETAGLKTMAERPYTFSVMPALDLLGAFDLPRNYISIHSNWPNPADIDLLARKGVAIAHIPDSNMRLSSGIAPIWQYAQKGMTVTLGTDGAASNDGISVFNAMRDAWNLQKLETLDSDRTAKEIDAWYIMRMATIEGARAIGMDDRTGSIAVGKQADIVLMSKNNLGLSPIIDAEGHQNIVALIIYSATERAIDTVISNGRIVVRGGELQPPLSEARLATALTDIANDVMVRQAVGKTWRQTFDLADIPRNEDWYRWRSIRRNDRIEITLTNSAKAPRRVMLAMSGFTEAGATAPMLSPETLARFPLDPPEKYYARDLSVAAGATVTLAKAPGSNDYAIAIDGVTHHREGTDEQLLILAPAATTPPQ